MSGGGARLYLGAGAVVLALYFAPTPLAGSSVLYVGVGYSVALAIAVGLVRHRPRPRGPWVLFVLAQLVCASADLCYYLVPAAAPSPGDLLYLAFYPLQAAGLVLLIRSRDPRRTWSGILDATILAVGTGLLTWLYVLEPLSRNSTGSGVERALAMTYPVMDVILLGVTVRLVIGTRGRSPALVLLVASTVLLVITDIAYAAVGANGVYVDGSLPDAGWLASYVLWGAAALHPSMRTLSARLPETGAALSQRRLTVMTVATLVPPVTLLANSIWPITGFDVPMAAFVAASLFLLVLGRMLGLVKDLRDAVRRHERGQQRERTLREVAASLTAARDRESIWTATVDGAGALVADFPGLVVDLAAPGRTAAWNPDGRLPDLVIPLEAQDCIRGHLLVKGADGVPAEVMDSLRLLADQAALALEGVGLAEDLHRQASDARVGALVQNSSDMILVVDADHRITYLTPSVATNLGHRPDELLGAPVTLLAPEEHKDRVAVFYDRLARRPGMSVSAEWPMRRADGSLLEIEAVCTNLLENPGVRGIVVTAHDITERKALAEGLERQVAELEELDRLKSELVATVSHELRTPLTSIIGEVEMFRDGDLGSLTADQEHGVDVIARNSDRLLSLIEDLLTLNQMEQSELRLRRTPTPVAGLWEVAVAQVAPLASSKGVDLVVQRAEASGSVLVDRALLDRALLNLLTNAVKFTPTGGRVAVGVRREGGEAVVSVTDTGVGIPAAEQDRLFTRFFRSSVATSMAIQGTGLGLVIVKQIVEEHGGSVVVDSVAGAGTTVTVRIPAEGPTARLVSVA